jgi:hypothetical protein
MPETPAQIAPDARPRDIAAPDGSPAVEAVEAAQMAGGAPPDACVEAPAAVEAHNGPAGVLDGAGLDLGALRDVRDARGRFVPGVPGPRLVHGRRSRTLAGVPALAEAQRERAEAIARDLGGAPTTLQATAIREAARLSLLVEALGDDLLARGVLSAKGACRAALGAYTQTLDRQNRIMTILGLERRARTVDPLDAVRAAVEAAGREDA